MDGLYALVLVGLTIGIALPVCIARVKNSRNRDGKAEAAESVYFDLSDENSFPDEQELKEALSARIAVWHVGKLARTVISQLDEGAAEKERLKTVIDSRFEPGSMTNEKFSAPVDEAYKTLVRNSAEASNRVQDFDGREFSRMRKLMSGDTYKQDAVPDAIQEARWSALSREYDSIEAIVNANKLILAEFSKLEKELLTLSEDDISDGSERLAEELDELSSHVKYYRDV